MIKGLPRHIFFWLLWTKAASFGRQHKAFSFKIRMTCWNGVNAVTDVEPCKHICQVISWAVPRHAVEASTISRWEVSTHRLSLYNSPVTKEPDRFNKFISFSQTEKSADLFPRDWEGVQKGRMNIRIEKSLDLKMTEMWIWEAPKEAD